MLISIIKYDFLSNYVITPQGNNVIFIVILLDLLFLLVSGNVYFYWLYVEYLSLNSYFIILEWNLVLRQSIHDWSIREKNLMNMNIDGKSKVKHKNTLKKIDESSMCNLMDREIDFFNFFVMFFFMVFESDFHFSSLSNVVSGSQIENNSHSLRSVSHPK